jgi:hypothetical protein
LKDPDYGRRKFEEEVIEEMDRTGRLEDSSIGEIRC